MIVKITWAASIIWGGSFCVDMEMEWYNRKKKEEAMHVDNVIDFIAKKKEREEQQRQQALEQYVARHCKLDQSHNIHALVESKEIGVEDHTLFLGFLSILKEEQIEPAEIFQDVFSLEPAHFEMTYNMKWWSVVQLAFTFLSILKTNEPHTYADFLGLSF